VRLTDRESVPSECGDEGDSASGLYRALMAHVLHQDRLVWDMARLVVVLQGGVLGTSFALCGQALGSHVLLVGALLTGVLLALVYKCEIDRDVNRRLMDALSARLVPEVLRSELLPHVGQEPIVRIAATPPRWCPFLRGRVIIRCVLGGFAVFDMLLAVLFWMRASWLCPMAGSPPVPPAPTVCMSVRDGAAIDSAIDECRGLAPTVDGTVCTTTADGLWRLDGQEWDCLLHNAMATALALAPDGFLRADPGCEVQRLAGSAVARPGGIP
jgi:hypothetical protein